jgi:hypothetical protein
MEDRNTMKIEKVQLPEFTETDDFPEISKDEINERFINVLKRMEERGLSHLIIYGDKEHFGNLAYITGGYDSRFEESLLIIPKNNQPVLILGNEGMSYSDISLLNHKKELFQTFSLQGMTRDKKKYLSDIFMKYGINTKSKIGIIGIKYYEEGEFEDPSHTFDIPHYVIEEIVKLAPHENLVNATDLFSQPENGLRCAITYHDLARFEFMNNYISNQMKTLLTKLDVGISEVELISNFKYKGIPFVYHPVVNFGTDRVLLGLAHPTFNRQLKIGDTISIAIGVSGANVARTGIAASSKEDFFRARKRIIDEYYYPYFKALKLWYESLSVGTSANAIYSDILKLIGSKKFSMDLNPGHQIHLEEWINSPFRKEYNYLLKSGMVLQCDIISFPGEPYGGVHVEDTVALADSNFRDLLKKCYKETWKRIEQRKEMMKNLLGIKVGDDVLPLSNIQAVLHPFLLDPRFIICDV